MSVCSIQSSSRLFLAVLLALACLSAPAQPMPAAANGPAAAASAALDAVVVPLALAASAAEAPDEAASAPVAAPPSCSTLSSRAMFSRHSLSWASSSSSTSTAQVSQRRNMIDGVVVSSALHTRQRGVAPRWRRALDPGAWLAAKLRLM